MTDSFHRNGARAWFARLAVLLVILAVLAAGLAAVATAESGGTQLLASLLGSGSVLNGALNVGIVALFLVGLVMTLGWLRRASRQEHAINRFWAANLGVDAPGRGRLRSLATLSLEGVGPSAVRDRVQVLTELAQAGAPADASALAEALADSEEPRVAVARYTAGVLVLVGLLGTFVGLLLTIGGVSDAVQGLGVAQGDDVQAFLVQLRQGLESPLQGMAVAFSTSLLGLAGSLCLGAGALALSAAQASWMGKLEQLTALFLLPAANAGMTGAGALGRGAGVTDAGLAHVAQAAFVLGESQQAMVSHLGRLDVTSARLAGAVDDFRTHVEGLAGHLGRTEELLRRLAEGQAKGAATLERSLDYLGQVGEQVAALRGEVRDGRAEISGSLQVGAQSLRAGVEEALAALASTLAATQASTSPPSRARRATGEEADA